MPVSILHAAQHAIDNNTNLISPIAGNGKRAMVVNFAREGEWTNKPSTITIAGTTNTVLSLIHQVNGTTMDGAMYIALEAAIGTNVSTGNGTITFNADGDAPVSSATLTTIIVFDDVSQTLPYTATNSIGRYIASSNFVETMPFTLDEIVGGMGFVCAMSNKVAGVAFNLDSYTESGTTVVNSSSNTAIAGTKLITVEAITAVNNVSTTLNNEKIVVSAIMLLPDEVAAGVSITTVDADNTIFRGQTSIEVLGNNFGATQGTIIVSPTNNVADSFAYTLTADTWSDTSITFVMPMAMTLMYGDLHFFVVNDDTTTNANGKIVIYSPPAANQYLTIWEQNPLGVLKDVTGLAFGTDQLEWQTLSAAGGTVTVGPSGTVYINDYPGNVPNNDTIYIRLGDASDYTWSSTLVEPITYGNVIPVIAQPPHATIDLGDTFTYTPSGADVDDVIWFIEYGPDAMRESINPETGTITWDTSNLARGQGIKVGLGCSNGNGESLVWFIIHVRHSSAPNTKLVLLGTDTSSSYIRIGSNEAIFNSGDTLVIPAGKVWASVSSDQDYVNTWADNFAGDAPSGTANQLTTFMSDGFTIIDGGPHDGIPRQDECFEVTSSVTPSQYVKYQGLEWKGNNRQAILTNAPNTVMELVGASDSGYAVLPTTFTGAGTGADQPWASLAVGYLQGDGSVWDNSYAFGQGRYLLQFGNVISNTLMTRNIVRPDDYHGDQPRGGITHYSTEVAGIFNNWVMDADHEHLAPFYKNYAGAFTLPATGNQLFPNDQLLRANGVINCDLIAFLSDGNGELVGDAVTVDNFVAVNTTNQITPQTSSTSPYLFRTRASGTFSKVTAYDVTEYASQSYKPAFIAQVDSSNDLAISGGIFYRMGWNGSLNENVGDLVSANNIGTTIDNCNVYEMHASAVIASGTVVGTNINTSTDPTLNGMDYPVRSEPGSPLAVAGQGADLTTFANPSHVMPLDTGWREPTTVWAWPHPAEQHIASRMATYSKSGLAIRSSSFATNPTAFNGTIEGNRGFATNTESFSEYVWGQFGRTVPPLRVSAALTGVGEITLRIAKYRSYRGNTITKFNIYETGDLVNPVATTTSHKAVLTGVANGDYNYVIKAVDATQTSAWGAQETGESGPSKILAVSVLDGATGSISQNMNGFTQGLTGLVFPTILTGAVTQAMNGFSQSMVGNVTRTSLSGPITQVMNSFTQQASGVLVAPGVKFGPITQNMNRFSQSLAGGLTGNSVQGIVAQNMNRFTQNLSGSVTSDASGVITQSMNGFSQALNGSLGSAHSGSITQYMNGFTQKLGSAIATPPPLPTLEVSGKYTILAISSDAEG